LRKIRTLPLMLAVSSGMNAGVNWVMPIAFSLNAL
jgi:hypothetical protein